MCILAVDDGGEGSMLKFRRRRVELSDPRDPMLPRDEGGECSVCRKGSNSEDNA